MNIEVIPAIIPKSLDDLKRHLLVVKGIAPKVQIDVIDGIFAPEPTWPYADGADFKKIVSQEEGLPFWKDFNFEIDMMVSKPEDRIDEWIDAGIGTIIIHLTSTDEHDAIFKQLRAKGVKCGIAILPSDHEDDIFGWIEAEAIDFVQVMGSDEIGFHGVELEEEAVDKIRSIREEFPDVTISIDIGVDENTAPSLIEAGANKLVSGSYIFDAEDVREAIETLKGK